MKIYLALFNPNVHESKPLTISAHKTEEGANKAIEEYKKREREIQILICEKLDLEFDEDWDFDTWFGVKSMELKD